MKTKPTSSLLLTFILVFLTCTIMSCTRITPYQGKNSPFAEDLTTIVNTLEAKHPNPYSQINRQEFRALATSLGDTYSETDSATQYFAMRSLLSKLGDSHTNIGMSQKLQENLEIFPVGFSRFDGHYYLGAIDKTNEAHLGEEIASINGYPMEKIETELSLLVSHDNEAWLYKSVVNLMNLPLALIFAGLAKQGEPLLLKTKEGTNLSVQAILSKDLQKDSFATLKSQNVPLTYPDGKAYRYFSIDKNTLFVQYNSCTDDKDYPIKQFIAEVTNFLKTEKPANVLFDLRFNGGGNSALLEPLIDTIATLQKKQTCNLYVLIAGGTFSSALMNAVQFKQRTDCTLVGTPTGGSVNHFGELKTKKLENSGNTLYYSTRHFVMDKKLKGSLQPDILIEQTLADYITGKDSVVASLTH
ncbi:hypothetical protein [uncultured Sphaerochaeta sp.]|uniref:hypothetical protein n=1 Tax=uncultured Sphaerochaeta sp. TaxID=886478 RepID=UPI002A0A9618|nr:hypothetical protein [uncultured Sphaerochaeta sp.]